MLASMPATKTTLLQLPQARLRSTTITTPIVTPVEGLSEFLTDQQLHDLLHSRRNHFNTLPAEIKAHVFTFLSSIDKIRCRAVSLEWSRLLADGAQWQILDTSQFPSRIPPEQLARLVEQASPYIQHLNLRGCSHLRSSTICMLDALTSLCLEGCRGLSSRSLSALLSRNVRLRQIDVSGLNAVNEQVLGIITTSCTYLEALNLNYCSQIPVTALCKVVKTFPRLQDLRISELDLDADLMFALNKLNTLRRLTMSGCTSLTDDLMRILIYGSTDYGVIFPDHRVQSSLFHLDISRCTTLSPGGLRYMQCTLPRLEKLELAGMIALSDAALARVLPTFTRLTHIDFEDCHISDETLAALSLCEHVRHVQLSHCLNITDRGVLCMIERLTLTHLDLDNTNVTNEVLNAVATKSHTMRLSIYDCPHISWTGVLSILTANSAQPAHLKRLKTFYGWQRPVDGHTKRILNENVTGARDIEKEWAAYMMESSEEVMRTGEGRTRFLDFDDEGTRILGRNTRRRMRACSIM